MWRPPLWMRGLRPTFAKYWRSIATTDTILGKAVEAPARRGKKVQSSADHQVPQMPTRQ